MISKKQSVNTNLKVVSDYPTFANAMLNNISDWQSVIKLFASPIIQESYKWNDIKIIHDYANRLTANLSRLLCGYGMDQYFQPICNGWVEHSMLLAEHLLKSGESEMARYCIEFAKTIRKLTPQVR